MEYEVHKDQVVTLEEIPKVMDGFEFDYYSSESNEGKEWITGQAIFFVLVDFLVVFREEEGLYDGDENKCQILYAALPSRSTFKGKTGEIFHLIVITIKCNSGLEIGPFFWKEIIISGATESH